MGLFSSKSDKEKVKREKADCKAENEKVLNYFKNHSDYNVGICILTVNMANYS